MADNSSQIYSPSGYYDIGSSSNRVGNIYCSAGAVTQGTSNTTAVTLNTTSGVITNFGAAIPAVTDVSFTVNNDKVTANSAVTATVCNFAGTLVTNGIPVASVSTVAAGSFVIHITNVHATNTTGANAVKVAFEVAG